MSIRDELIEAKAQIGAPSKWAKGPKPWGSESAMRATGSMLSRPRGIRSSGEGNPFSMETPPMAAGLVVRSIECEHHSL